MSSDSISTERPLVSVVVPCRNEAQHIEECVGSILSQEGLPGGLELLVADGMSEDGTRQLLERRAAADSRLRLVSNPRRTTPCGMNCGVRLARGQWIAIMGSHNRYAPDYLLRCLETARATGADNVGGAMFCEGDGLVQRAIAAAHHSPFSVGGARWHDPGYAGPADTVFGGFFKADVFTRVGLFDEELVRNQDDELNLRLRRAGGRIWQSPEIRSWYHPRSSLAALFRQYSQYGYWKVRVIQKHKLPASWRHLVPGGFLLWLLMLVVMQGWCWLSWAVGMWPVGLNLWPAWALMASLGIYCTAVLLASLSTAGKHQWKLLWILPCVFACYHLGYGYGFLRGIWDFVLRRTSPAAEFTQTTRGLPSA